MDKKDIIGIMSGTSLDGLDIAHCTFDYNNSSFSFKINRAQTIQYNELWKQRLTNAHELNGLELVELHNQYGKYIGEQVKEFCKLNQLTADYIASHGHTIFHQPEKQITFQMGHGAAIRAESNITTINDFRSLDVAYKGQGAPLVPIGDHYLFSEYDACLNLGGFANVSYSENGKRMAFDICPVNIVLNYMAKKKNLVFDRNGDLGRQGKIAHRLLKDLDNLDYYKLTGAKSLGREWVEGEFLAKVKENHNRYTFEDIIRTIYEHISVQLSKNLLKHKNVLVTGGGAFNSYLIELLENRIPNTKIIIPEKEIVEYKEALLFAFLGYLNVLNHKNVLKSYTGAESDSISGSLWK